MSGLVLGENALPATDSPVRVGMAAKRIDVRYWLVATLLLLGCAAFLVDLAVSQWMHTRQGLKFLHGPLQVVEALGDGFGAFVVLFSLYLVSVERRRELLRVVCSVLASGVATNSIKFCIARLRPRSYPGEGLLHVSSVSDTFYGWFPFLQSDAVAVGSRYQSFPSAHTATGFAMAVALSRMYPRGAWWFGVLAAMIALQRVETGAHYVSDTCFGAAVGMLAALIFQSGTAWSRWFDAYEKNGTPSQTSAK